MKQRRKGKHRNVWEVFWTIGNRDFLVQEWNYNRVIQRLAWLESQPEVVKRRGYRQIQR
jgi:hypothetical protein